MMEHDGECVTQHEHLSRNEQAEDAYGATKQAANDYAESGKQTYEDSKQAASDYAGSAQQAAQDGYEATKDTVRPHRLAAPQWSMASLAFHVP